jgi:hypothetical protein
MKKCKNVECNNEVEGKKQYCSLKCRNVYVNKYLRDYSKNSKGLSKPHKKKYENNPKCCKKCDKKIPYEKRNNDFCNSSCSASFNNIGRKGIKYELSEIGLKNSRKCAYENLIISNKNINSSSKCIYLKEEYYKNPKRCKKL